MFAIIILSLVIVAQAAYIAALQRSPMGVLTATALRIRLAMYSMLRIRCFVIGLDIRKMKSMNTCLGYSHSNNVIGKFISFTRRYTDIVGQYGGDEFVIVGRYDKRYHSADIMIKRLLAKRDEINATMPSETREKLSINTQGLVNGLDVAIAYIEDTRDARGAAVKCIDATEPLKAGGRETGNRDTSGKVGTLIAKLS